MDVEALDRLELKHWARAFVFRTASAYLPSPEELQRLVQLHNWDEARHDMILEELATLKSELRHRADILDSPRSERQGN